MGEFDKALASFELAAKGTFAKKMILKIAESYRQKGGEEPAKRVEQQIADFPK